MTFFVAIVAFFTIVSAGRHNDSQENQSDQFTQQGGEIDI